MTPLASYPSGRDRTASEQTVCTPPELIAACQGRYGKIIIDLAATFTTSITRYFIGDPATEYTGESVTGDSLSRCIALDALSTPWPETPPGSWGWCNPPFSHGGDWAQKCFSEMLNGRNTMLLLPASVDSAWYKKWVEPVAVRRFLAPRVKFVGHSHPFPKPLMLALYSQELTIGPNPIRGEARCRQWAWKDFLEAHNSPQRGRPK